MCWLLPFAAARIAPPATHSLTQRMVLLLIDRPTDLPPPVVAWASISEGFVTGGDELVLHGERLGYQSVFDIQ